MAADTVRQCLARALAAIEQAEPELARLDAAAGDGDHGAGMVRGLRAAAAAAVAVGAGECLVQAGEAFADAAGGASGALIGTYLTTLGQSLPADEPTPALLHQALAAGLAAVQRLGKARPGDKTMVDTLEPFTRAFGEAVQGGAAIGEAWQAALPAAEAGALATAEMLCRRGRASRLGERSRGHLDPGAISMLAILRAAGEILV